MLHSLILLAALAAPPQPVEGVANVQKWAAAGATCPLTGSCKLLNAVACTASPTNRTFTIPVSHYNVTTIQIDYTWAAAETDLTLTCTASLNAGASYASITSSNIASGVGTLSPYHDDEPVSASGNILVDYKTARYDSMKCVVAVTACASGTFNVHAVSATE